MRKLLKVLYTNNKIETTIFKNTIQKSKKNVRHAHNQDIKTV